MLQAMLALTAAMVGGAQSEPAKPAAVQTVQQRFDAATLAAQEGRCEDAVATFDALEKLPAIQRNQMARLTLGLRRARCLIGTDRAAAAERDIAAALPVLEQRGDEFADETAYARMLLAFAAKQRGDYDGAIRANEDRLARASGVARLPMLLALADLTMFDHDGRALRYAEEARALATPAVATKGVIAQVQTAYARVLLNEGRKAEAYKVLKDSLAKQGGLTLKVSVSDLETRSDLALAALVTGDRDEARRYLAYTGAGRTTKPFTQPVQMDLPTCGRDGLKPEDFAIIGMSVQSDGRVTGVSPIYVGGNRATALAFVQAVRGWSWRPDVAAAVPPVMRAVTRIELRCTNGSAERLSLSQILLDAAGDWVPDPRGSGTAWQDMSAAAALPRQRAALNAARDDRPKLAALVALLENPLYINPDRKTATKDAEGLGRTLSAPPALRLYLAMKRVDSEMGEMFFNGRKMPSFADAYRNLLSDPVIAGDPLAAAVVRVATATELRRNPSEAGVLLDAAIAQPGLPARHPVKVRALLLKANLLGARGDVAGARAALAQTGLSAEQCAIGGVVPMMKRSGAGAGDYPDAARDMGFEGWARTEFDVAANGRTVAPRTIAAYPPFVFSDAATGIARDARYASSFQPDTPVACAANSMTIRFNLPD